MTLHFPGLSNLQIVSVWRDLPLYSRKHDPTNIRTAVKAKRSPHLIERQEFRKFPDVVQEMSAHVLQIAVYERLLHVETAGDDIFCILQSELVRILERQSLPEKCLLVIRQHDYYPNHQLRFQKVLVEGKYPAARQTHPATTS
jgi:hypothetical protein